MICSLLIVNVFTNAPLQLDAAKLRKLWPVFKDVSSVTAGNSSSIRYSHLLDYLFPLPLSLTLFMFFQSTLKGYTSATFLITLTGLLMLRCWDSNFQNWSFCIPKLVDPLESCSWDGQWWGCWPGPSKWCQSKGSGTPCDCKTPRLCRCRAGLLDPSTCNYFLKMPQKIQSAMWHHFKHFQSKDFLFLVAFLSQHLNYFVIIIWKILNYIGSKNIDTFHNIGR